MLLWREIQKNNFTSVKKLADFLQLDDFQQQKLLYDSSFPLNLPIRLAEKISKKTLDDPILLQFVPHISENVSSPLFSPDPLEEKEFLKSKKLLIKYHSRALLITTSACAMHCRFCFRRHFPYEHQDGFEKELKLIEEDKNLEEIILSGGDPLSLSDRVLKNLLFAFENMSHIKRIRFHTRFPIGIPERISNEFLSLLSQCNKQIFFVIHANHPKEFDSDVIFALKKIHKLGIPILNQWVLLKGVNDSFETLKELCQLLINNGFLPYYLFALDEVEGASHFESQNTIAQSLMNNLASELSGYGVPKFVKEIPGSPSKTSLF